MDKHRFMEDVINSLGLSAREGDSLFRVAARCARFGVPTAAAGMLMMAGSGAVVIPGIGAIPGALAGALSGMYYGTLACTAVSYPLRGEIDKLLREAHLDGLD